MNSSRANEGTTKNSSYDGAAHFFRARFKTLDIPMIRDAVVIGQQAPASLETLIGTLRTMCPETLIGLTVSDDVVGSIIIRETLLKKFPRALIERFILQKVKPHMSSSEVLRLDLELEIVIEANV